jgi:diguanylate cyclase (GGDEF)-like protein/PAS domain S-box-containing protein
LDAIYCARWVSFRRNSTGIILKVNHAFTKDTGYAAKEAVGQTPGLLRSGRHDAEFYRLMWESLKLTGTWQGEVWDKRKNGEIYLKWLSITSVKDNNGVVTHYVGIHSDITARKKAETEIHNLAFYDVLTKLPNRRFLLDKIEQAQIVSVRSNQYGALLFLDMDRFKTLNDTMGHDHGDMFLVEVAKRMRQCVREVDTVARIGGDEFVVLMEEVGLNADDVSQRVAVLAEKIRSVLSIPYQLKKQEHLSSPSIGVTLYKGRNVSVDTLLKQADMAMYQAKDSGRNTVRFFDPSMQETVEARATIEADLRHAVQDNQLRLHYQIQLDSDLRPLGAEALIRWLHPVRGMVSPINFIPIAEESSQILDIGNWVLKTACKQLALWSKHEKSSELTLAVNVSALQFKQQDFVENLTAMVHTHQINPNRLKLELTESVVLSDVSDVVTKMHALKALGVRLSLDDFGTGYSSLSYLKQLPLDQIKIDQSFIRDVLTDASDAVMVQTIIDLAKNFRINVIAEGVETEAQLNFLKQNGCMAYQGYLFSKPVPIDEFEKLLTKD